MTENRNSRSEEAARVDEDLDLDADRADQVTGGKIKATPVPKPGSKIA